MKNKIPRVYTLMKCAVHANTQRPMVTTDLAHESTCLVHKPSGYVSAVRSTCSVCQYCPWFGYADSADGILILGTKILVHRTKSFWGAANH
jgi:hypothetical protein